MKDRSGKQDTGSAFDYCFIEIFSFPAPPDVLPAVSQRKKSLCKRNIITAFVPSHPYWLAESRRHHFLTGFRPGHRVFSDGHVPRRHQLKSEAMAAFLFASIATVILSDPIFLQLRESGGIFHCALFMETLLAGTQTISMSSIEEIPPPTVSGILSTAATFLTIPECFAVLERAAISSMASSSAPSA
jgi:hypothetical protein